MNEKLENSLINLMEKRHFTLAVAESCTGGLISERITRVPGASKIFLGGVVAYAYSAKTRVLDVSSLDLERDGAVSETIARQMAEGVRLLMGSTFSIGVTGIAGPAGATEKKPVGTVYVALCGPHINEVKHLVLPNEGRNFIRQSTATYALEWLLSVATLT